MKKHQLSYYEKRSLVSIVVMLLVYGSMFYDASVYYRSENPAQELLNFWGNQFLELFLCLIVAHLFVMFAFNTINRKLTGEVRPKIKDERDNAIELKAINASYYIFTLGVFIAMLSALRVENYSPIFLGIMGSFLVSGLVADIIRIISYRRSS
jgi:heme/copper-type cytochrome/quinol oxidase subunit 2